MRWIGPIGCMVCQAEVEGLVCLKCGWYRIVESCGHGWLLVRNGAGAKWISVPGGVLLIWDEVDV